MLVLGPIRPQGPGLLQLACVVLGLLPIATCQDGDIMKAALLQFGRDLTPIRIAQVALSNWNPDTDPCGSPSWHHVHCEAVAPDHSVRIPVAVDLSGLQLTSQLPVSISGLTSLTRLTFSNNGFTGPIPPSLFMLPRLVNLSLATNVMSGSIPPGISSLSALAYLDLGYNWFARKLPDSISLMASLQYLSLGSNVFTGELPPSLSAVTALTSLSLDNNRFNGSLPGEWSALSHLSVLHLSQIQALTGSIPPEWAALTALETFSASYDTRLCGSVNLKASSGVFSATADPFQLLVQDSGLGTACPVLAGEMAASPPPGAAAPSSSNVVAIVVPVVVGSVVAIAAVAGVWYLWQRHRREAAASAIFDAETASQNNAVPVVHVMLISENKVFAQERDGSLGGALEVEEPKPMNCTRGGARCPCDTAGWDGEMGR